MDITKKIDHISEEERSQVSRQVHADLVDHLYEGCMPGVISGGITSIVFFLIYYHYTPLYLLVVWIASFDITILLLAVTYGVYVKYKNYFSSDRWERTYSIVMTACALLYVPCVLLMPADTAREFLVFIGLIMVANAFATGTVGQFNLCLVTVSLILVPAIIFCLILGGVFHYLIAFLTVTYMGFLFGLNHRSTRWYKDSIQLKVENTLVSYQANHDILTNLPNERLLPRYIDEAIEVANVHQSNFALVSFSLNRMEIINDSLGHAAGNLIIEAVTNRLNDLVSRMDKSSQYIVTLSRLDTFFIILTPLNPTEAEERINILFSVLDAPFYLADRAVKMTASIGVSFYPDFGKDAPALIMNANIAMLKAKQLGGNNLKFYKSDINIRLPKQLEIETDLYSALKKNQFVLFYQPLIDLHTNTIAGTEALIRWQHPKHGFIPPLNFIPIAEETGLIVPIGTWVIEEACKQGRKWHDMGFNKIKVAVNLAEKQLRQENIISVITRIINMTKFDPRFLEIEITETAILDESIPALMMEFKKLGLSLAIDDFGTGYSGLSYLKRFSIDKLKIDQSFVRDIPENQDSITIVSAIIAMARELKIKTLAEGVETKEQLDFLRSKQCDYIQGYYYSQPVDASFFTELLIKYRELAI